MLLLKYLLCLLPVVLSQTIKEITESTPKQSSLAAGTGAYYYFEVPDNSTDYYLMVKVTPNSDLDAFDNIFSDPNLYISTTNKFPSNHHNAEWYSQRFGDEIITIDNKYVKPKTMFYIGVFCELKCNYILSAKLYKNYVMRENIIYGVSLKPDETIRVKFTTKEQFNELAVSCIGLSMEPFRMYLAKENPSSANTLKPFPIYSNGYRISVIKGTADYATNSTYELLIVNQGKQNELRLWLKYDNNEIPIKQMDSIFETAKKYSNVCFKYPMTNQDRTLIISFSLFSGSGYIQIGGWNSIANLTYNEIPYNEYTYEIDSDRVIKLTKSDFDKFDQNKGDSYLHYCFFASEAASLINKVYYLDSAELIQKLNFLLPGKYLTDYLPKQKSTRYSLLHINTNKNITITLENKQSSAKLYAVFCNEQDCFMNKTRVEQDIAKGLAIEGFKTFNGYEITLDKTTNKCLEPNIAKKLSSCSLVIATYCNSETTECIYNVGFSHPDTVTFMTPRTPYYNVLAHSREDNYELEILDTETKNLAIVLNQHTGETELCVYKYTQNETTKYIIETQFNHDFLPNVITIEPYEISSENLVGKFYVRVKSHAFSSYTLYYYTFNDYDSPLPDHTVISMKLEKGHIIQDFFQNNKKIKVYSFENTIGEGEVKHDLRIILTRINIYCTVYVFKDLDNYKYNSNSSYFPIEGYLWKSDYNNEIIISKDDPYYYTNAEYYLVVYKSDYFNDKKTNPNYSSFYIGITDEESSFLLSEGMEHKTTLTPSTYKNQSYYYTHLNLSEPLSISFNLFYGKINVFISIEGKEYSNSTLSSTSLFNLETTDLKEFCQEKNQTETFVKACGISINVTNVNALSSQYLLVIKRPGVPEHLTPGTVRTQRIVSGEKQYFILDAIPTEDIGVRVSARFTNGNGDLYINRLKNTLTMSMADWPNETRHEYEARQFSARGKSVNIPYEDIKAINPCQLLVTVVGRAPSFDSNRIEYAISFSTDAITLNINTNYNFFISTGEVQFFSFRHEGFSQKLYISMSNKEGDADLYLNYGKHFPSLEQYNWKSTGAYTEFLELSKDDNYFVSKGLQEIDGEYSLMIYGYSNTSYSLYISSDENKIMVLTDDYPASCTCQDKDDMCYFRYEGINSFNIKEVVEKEIIFTIDYTYGNGMVYGKLFKDGNNAVILKNLPNETNYDYINNRRHNYVRVPLKKDNEKYTVDSTLMLGVKCTEKSLFDINSVKLKTNNDIDKSTSKIIYLDLNHDNIFYLSVNRSDVNLTFFLYKQEDLNFEVRAYSGEARIRAFLNNTNWVNGTWTHTYHHIADFEVKEGDYNSFYSSVKKELGYNHYVYFNVKPITDVVFYIKLDFDTDWTRIPIGKMSNHLITKNVFNGYFDMLPEYDEVMLSITNESPNKKIYSCIKMNIINKNSTNENNTYNYSYPSKSNYDQMLVSNPVLSSLSFKIQNVPEEMRENSTSVRLLFTVGLEGYENINTEEKIYIVVSPNVNHYKRVRTEQGMYYYTSLMKANEDQVVFNMLKKKSEDDLMVIEISSCQGDFDYKITDDISGNGDIAVDKIDSSMVSSNNGRKVIHVHNLKNNDYYLSVWGTENGGLECLTNSENCTKDIDFLMFYYTTNSKKYNHTISSPVFDYEHTGKGEIVINLPKLYQKDLYGNEQKLELLTYTLVYTQNPEKFRYMESVCYLSKLYESIANDTEAQSIEYKYNHKTHTIRVKGLKKNEKYFMNVLITNPVTGEVLTFKPVQVISDYGAISWFLIGMFILGIVIVTFIAGYFYNKYRQTNEQLNYEQNDIRNLSSVPKSMAEMRDLARKKEKEKYVNLTEDSQNI